MIPRTVRYTRASDVDHALELLAEPDAHAIAGGQSLVAVMKLRIARPSLVVDISWLDLRGCDVHNGALHIGPLTTWSELLTSNVLQRPALAALAECASGIGDLQVRNRGTIGGSLAQAHPASDMPAVLLALGATLQLRSPDGERAALLADFLLGPFMTSLGTQELIVDIVVAMPAPGSGSAYVCVEQPASGFALAGAAALVGSEGESTVAITGVGARPFVLPAGVDRGEALAATEIFGDTFAPAEYRRELASVVAQRALQQARERAGGIDE